MRKISNATNDVILLNFKVNMKPYYQDEWVTIYHGDCRDILPDLPKVDLVLTDPPYPNVNAEEYKYSPELIFILNSINCRQYVFWTAREEYPFPLEFTAKHIWDKKNGGNCQYEMIYERNGQRRYKVYRHYLINSTVAASFTGDVFNEHPSQKPIKLIRELVLDGGGGDIVVDPFMGSGTTLRAGKDLNRHCIGIEILEKYCEIAAIRCSQGVFNLAQQMV